MLIDLQGLCEKYDFIPNGIIHIGGHTGEESEVYENIGIKNIVWVEAIEAKYLQIVNKVRNFPMNFVVNKVVSDKDNEMVNFHQTDNFASSSIFPLGTHKHHHPKVSVVEITEVKTTSLDTIMDHKLKAAFQIAGRKVEDFDTLNLDIQGAELLALKGYSKNLKNIDWIYTEVNEEHLYEGCCLMGELDEYLSEFSRVETQMSSHMWGDALYIRIKN